MRLVSFKVMTLTQSISLKTVQTNACHVNKEHCCH